MWLESWVPQPWHCAQPPWPRPSSSSSSSSSSLGSPATTQEGKTSSLLWPTSVPLGLIPQSPTHCLVRSGLPTLPWVVPPHRNLPLLWMSCMQRRGSECLLSECITSLGLRAQCCRVREPGLDEFSRSMYLHSYPVLLLFIRAVGGGSKEPGMRVGNGRAIGDSLSFTHSFA